MTLQTHRVQTLERVHAFVEDSEAVDFMISDCGSACELIKGMLIRLNCHMLLKTARLEMTAAHRQERAKLDGTQKERLQAEGLKRSSHVCTGFKGLWDKLSGNPGNP